MRTSALLALVVPLSMLAGIALWIIGQALGVTSAMLPYQVDYDMRPVKSSSK